MMEIADYRGPTMDQIIGLCKQRGIIFQSSEIYNGVAGCFDYGPLGAEIKKNIKNIWWQDMVHRRSDIVGLDCSIIMHSDIWRASGHVDGFSDPLVDCKISKMRYRADQLYFAKVIVGREVIGYVSVLEDEKMQSVAENQAQDLKRKLAKQGALAEIVLQPYTEARPEEYALIPSPATGKPGSLTAPRAFNLMFQTHLGAVVDDSSVAYLRPETAQGMFVNFKNILNTYRVKLPFGIAQMGRSFRNEITPRNFIFRSREFEQMEMEFFIQDDADWQEWHQYWVKTRFEWLKSIGLGENFLGLDVHRPEKLAHYSRACTDITFHYPFGVQELEGVAARGNFDLRQHQNASGKNLEYFDEQRNRSYLPHVIEPAIGVDRLFLAVLCSAYCEEPVGNEMRAVLKLHPRVAPIKAAILPLVKNRSELVSLAEKIYQKLSKMHHVQYDEGGAIGRRYRRMDEIGTPYCITVDFDSLENGTFTLRDRDTMEQKRLTEGEIITFLADRCL
ncbi:MAG: glycine--tRNA ligase [Puniceicoccales bacterium]|jgi:glycyl-tRNA synthetase|nr:glycine--tRNA ligase [Puniceicoccales bacterium]